LGKKVKEGEATQELMDKPELEPESQEEVGVGNPLEGIDAEPLWQELEVEQALEAELGEKEIEKEDDIFTEIPGAVEVDHGLEKFDELEAQLYAEPLIDAEEFEEEFPE
jgi:hypothetical protein